MNKFMSMLAMSVVLWACSAWSANPAIEASNGRKLGAAHFEIDEDTKSLIVTTDPETNETIRKIIEELDRPVPQALIKVLFLEVTHGDDFELGAEISYNSENSDGDKSIVESLFAAKAYTTGSGTFAVLEDDLQVTLNALSEVTSKEVLSRPSVMARNNEEATITIGSEMPFIRNTQTTDAGGVLNTVEYEDIGIILTVTPHITDDGMVELDVAPEISTLAADSVPISDTVDAPTFDKRSAETRVLVPSGRTVVIGGLMDTQETEVIKKVPFLGDIWLIGRLFRNKSTEKQKKELLIFLTPTVVTTREEMARLTAGEHGSSESLRKYDYQKEAGAQHSSPVESE